MTRDRTAFPDILSTGDPLAIDHHRLNREDPRGDSAVFPPDDVPIPEVGSPSPVENVQRTPEPSAEAATYKEQTCRWRAHDVNSAPAGAQIFEIARWRCPAGHLGIISAIETHLAISIPIDGAGTLEIALDLPWQPWLHLLFGLPFRWWLRLEDTRAGEELAPVILRGDGELPGHPFPELPTWNDQRFGWHYHGRQPLRLLVPEGHTARLFFGIEGNPRALALSKAALALGGDTPSPWKIDPNSPAAQKAIAIASQGAIVPSPTPSGDAAIAAAMVEPRAVIDDSGIGFAGRLIGTLQTYRASRNATEAARRGL